MDSNTQKLVRSLNKDGIVVSSKLTDPVLLGELSSESLRIFRVSWNTAEKKPLRSEPDYKGDRAGMDKVENKDFLVNLTPKTLSSDSVFLRYALQPNYIRIANAYLGQRARMRAVQLWLNYATDDEAASTQLFHRDGDDLMNLKIFTYLTDVKGCNGPFVFIPGSQPLGNWRINPAKSKYDRVSDEEMIQVAPRDKWMVCVGNAGDVIFADTCGYHKGLKPVEGYRLMLMVHYTSWSARTGADYIFQNLPDGILSVEQMAAVA